MRPLHFLLASSLTLAGLGLLAPLTANAAPLSAGAAQQAATQGTPSVDNVAWVCRWRRTPYGPRKFCGHVRGRGYGHRRHW